MDDVAPWNNNVEKSFHEAHFLFRYLQIDSPLMWTYTVYPRHIIISEVASICDVALDVTSY